MHREHREKKKRCEHAARQIALLNYQYANILYLYRSVNTEINKYALHFVRYAHISIENALRLSSPAASNNFLRRFDGVPHIHVVNIKQHCASTLIVHDESVILEIMSGKT